MTHAHKLVKLNVCYSQKLGFFFYHCNIWYNFGYHVSLLAQYFFYLIAFLILVTNKLYKFCFTILLFVLFIVILFLFHIAYEMDPSQTMILGIICLIINPI